jgi:hypothetical protein
MVAPYPCSYFERISSDTVASCMKQTLPAALIEQAAEEASR